MKVQRRSGTGEAKVIIKLRWYYAGPVVTV